MYCAITMVDGSVAIMQTVGDATPEDCLGKWPKVEQAKVVSHRPVSVDVIPIDRTFRNAWTDTGKAIEHDMDKARGILRDRLRAARAPQLAALDIESIRASEVGDVTALDRIRAVKQGFRDVTDDPRIDAAKTVEELKALSLEKLMEKN